MKKLKNIISLMVLAVVIYCVGIVNVYATNVTLDNTREGHRYEFYQIFSGDYSNGVLTNIEWGSGVDVTTDEFKLQYDGESARDVSEELIGVVNDSYEVRNFAKIISYYLAEDPNYVITLVKDEDNYGVTTIDVKESGYYLIKDVVVAGDNEYSRYILVTVGDDTTSGEGSGGVAEGTQGLVITLKYSTEPSFEKKVYDLDATDDDKRWVDVTDYAKTEDITFKLTATIPTSTIIDYEGTGYKVIFHDNFGFDFDFLAVDSVVISAANSDSVQLIDDLYVLTESADDDDYTEDFTLEISDLCSIMHSINEVKTFIYDNDEIYIDVIYRASIFERSNSQYKNTAYLEYSSNPNGSHDGSIETDTTPEDYAVVFTYGFDVYKTNESGDGLSGAEFKLEKLESDGTYSLITDVIVTSEYGRYFIEGLDSGTYRLTETKAPDGYNLLTEPIDFEINAIFNSNPDEYSTPYLASLTAKVDDVEIEGDTEKVYIEFNVLNTRGVSLPSTGGVGTIIFTVSGIIIMSIALLMIVKRRKQN